MKILVALMVAVLVEVVASQCSCNNMKWAKCDGDPCKCSLQFSGVSQTLDCSKLIPKCYLMKAEMYRAKNNLSTRSIGGKPVETAFVDNDGIYDPECESNGKFKAVQCNGTDVCWCVNSAGVRRSDKGDKNIKCEPVETYWVRLELKHKDMPASEDAAKWKTGIENVLLERYKLDKKFVDNVQYDKSGRLIVVDVKKDKGLSEPDLSLMTYYMEKDVKVLPLFVSPQPFEVSVEGNKVSMENILVYYVDEKAPTFTMQRLTGGIIAVIVVVSLIVIGGLLVIFFIARRQKAQYSKAQPREMETMS
ncbi:epithelial cell adhesion molecule [Puntigrus tetrazona]|uniref:epithelial cell adhesion molecule n=1 Tax=Puntigrus tetrazona TaxID=1606681 RepID=UPI001C8A31A3|nr:epithelial cell adhesion molecule [Puntigrus tetrazona]